MKKYLCLVILVLSFSLVFMGCSSVDDDSAEPSEFTTWSMKITLNENWEDVTFESKYSDLVRPFELNQFAGQVYKHKGDGAIITVRVFEKEDKLSGTGYELSDDFKNGTVEGLYDDYTTTVQDRDAYIYKIELDSDYQAKIAIDDSIGDGVPYWYEYTITSKDKESLDKWITVVLDTAEFEAIKIPE